jgi:hypothetical protein
MDLAQIPESKEDDRVRERSEEEMDGNGNK